MTDNLIKFCHRCEGWYSANQNVCPRCEKSPQELETGVISVSSIPLSVNAPQVIPKPLKRGKRQRSQKWEYKGYIFDSTPEKDRMLYLETLQDNGIISDLQPHPEMVIQKAVKIPTNAIHPSFDLPAENYTPDFTYFWNGLYIVEDVKAPRFTKKLKKLKPRVEQASKNKYKTLQRWFAEQRHGVFLVTVYHGSQWHYFTCTDKPIPFDLKQALQEAA